MDPAGLGHLSVNQLIPSMRVALGMNPLSVGKFGSRSRKHPGFPHGHPQDPESGGYGPRAPGFGVGGMGNMGAAGGSQHAMMNALRLFGQDRAASVYIEMALILPMLLFLMLGMINFSLVSMARTMAALAVEEGARAGAVRFNASEVEQYASNAVEEYNKLWSGSSAHNCNSAPGVWAAGNITVEMAGAGGSTSSIKVGEIFTVSQQWCVVNFYGGMAGLWGGNPDTAHFQATVSANGIKEGW